MQWLQYEMAVPLAMLGLIFLFVKIRKHSTISIYGYLEARLGVECRLIASGSFLFFRGVATGVTVYGVASVLQLITDMSYLQAVLALMVLTIIYDVFGGIKAVVYSDVLQMILLLAAIFVALFMLWGDFTANIGMLSERSEVLQNDWGFSGNQYGLWPMLFGGLFLYMAYYGCDQSQAQRILAAHDEKSAVKVLWLNGIFRFPLVFLYCLLGLALAAYAFSHGGFIEELPVTQTGSPNINLAFPFYVLQNFPPGFVGLVIVGLFAAAMSSIDSALNSLSASTVNDFILRSRDVSKKTQLVLAKLATLFWGVFAIVFSYQVEVIAPTVLEVINKVGSLINGPLLSLFIIAAFMPRVSGKVAITGFVLGFVVNVFFWLYMPLVSWLWWNVIGCLVSLIFVAAFGGMKMNLESFRLSNSFHFSAKSLLVYFFFICVVSALFPVLV